MKKTNRVLQCFIAIALICACVLFTLTACNPEEQTSTPNNGNNTSQTQQPSNDDDNDNTTQTPSSGSEDDDTPSTPSQTPSDDDKQDTSEEPSEKLTERDYFEKFQQDLANLIIETYNNRVTSEKSKISNVQIKLIDNKSGNIYFTCNRNNKIMLYLINNEDIANLNSYKECCEKLTDSFNTISVVSCQEADLAQEIFDYALEQQEVIDYLAENGIDKNELKLLNATKFEAKDGGYRTTDLIALSQNYVLTISLGGRTGVCPSQQAYFEELRRIGVERLAIREAIPFEKLKVAEDEA